MKTRVVLVDDHRMLREALRTLLEREPDMEVVGEAGDGRSMLRIVRETTPDVVVLDVAMPELGGIEAAGHLASRYPEVKVIGLSAYSDKRFVVEMLKAGAVGYVTKAAAGTELLRAIRAAMRGSSYLCPEVSSALVSEIKEPSLKTDSAGAELGKREREVLKLLAEGHRSAAIAARLFISIATVEAHRRNIMRKLDLHSLADLTKYAIREGITSL